MPFPVTVQAVSKHLKVLEHAGLITRGRAAQWRPARLRGRPLEGAAGWLARYRQVFGGRLRPVRDPPRALPKGRQWLPPPPAGGCATPPPSRAPPARVGGR